MSTACSTPCFSPEHNYYPGDSGKIAAQIFSNASSTLDDNTFTIPIEVLKKAAAFKQIPTTNKNFGIVKQTIPSKSLSNKHKRSKSIINSRNNTNIKSIEPLKIVGKKIVSSETEKNFMPDSRQNFNLSNMNTVSQHTKITQTNEEPKFLSYYSPRLLTLFFLGSLTSFVIDHLLTQNHITEYPKDITKLIDTAAWIPPTCGASAVLVGSLFPLADYWFMRKPQEFQGEWSNVMRCIGGFIGVAYAATKLSWSSNYQVSCTLALISFVLWFLFDRTSHGFMMSVLFSSIGTGVIFTQADFFGVRSWIPCILYSSCVCFGTIGRQLMIVPENWFEDENRKRNNEVKTTKFR